VKLENEKLLSIVEKPVHKIFINAGIYILERECIDLIPRQFYDMTLLFKKLILNKKKPYLFHWGNIGSILVCQKIMKKQNLNITLFSMIPINIIIKQVG
jgi:NDP-sugar pyrophosphorylase family protein|tara:strand:- start:638 stop:934 length:297 start_codon:yes stop_codon:yes gene_type:complete